MTELISCPECGAAWFPGLTCEECFHQMLYWENEDFRNDEVHHLTVLCYYLQHPSLYSPEGLEYGKGLLRKFVIENLDPQQARRASAEQVDSSKRKWKIAGTPESHGAYPTRPAWRMTAPDVVAGGSERYRASVRAWAQAVLEALAL